MCNLTQCKCGKTINTAHTTSPIMCDTCYDKKRQDDNDRKARERFRSGGKKKRVSEDLEKLAELE